MWSDYDYKTDSYRRRAQQGTKPGASSAINAPLQRPVAHGSSRRRRDSSPGISGRGWLGSPFADGRGHAHLIDHLEHLASGNGGGRRAADGDQWTGGLERSGDSGKRIGMAGSAGDEADAGLAMDAAMGVRGVRDAGLVPHVDNPNPATARHREHVIQMIADQAVMLHAGKVIAAGPLAQVRASEDPQVRAFFDRQPRPVTMERGLLETLIVDGGKYGAHSS